MCYCFASGQVRLGYIGYWIFLQGEGNAGIGPRELGSKRKYCPFPLFLIYFRNKGKGRHVLAWYFEKRIIKYI